VFFFFFFWVIKIYWKHSSVEKNEKQTLMLSMILFFSTYKNQPGGPSFQ